MAASVAAEMVGGRHREVDVRLTPVHEGRFEIYVNGEMVYDRKAEGAIDWVPFHRITDKIRDSLIDTLSAVPAAAR